MAVPTGYYLALEKTTISQERAVILVSVVFDRILAKPSVALKEYEKEYFVEHTHRSAYEILMVLDIPSAASRH